MWGFRQGIFHHPIIPLLFYSITPLLHRAMNQEKLYDAIAQFQN